MKIRGNTVGTTMPRTNYEQTDPAKADYLKGKTVLDKKIADAQTTANNANSAAKNAMTEAQKKTEKIATVATLSASGWANRYQEISVSDVTASRTVIVCSNPGNSIQYAECGVHCVAQGTDYLGFRCEEVPISDLYVNVLILI